MYLCVCELRQAGKQLLPPFPSTLAAPVMAAPVCVSLPLPGCWRQGFFDASTLFPRPSAKATHCLCQLQCSNFVPTTCLFSRDHKLGQATQPNLNVKAGATKRLPINDKNTHHFPPVTGISKAGPLGSASDLDLLSCWLQANDLLLCFYMSETLIYGQTADVVTGRRKCSLWNNGWNSHWVTVSINCPHMATQG